MCAKVGDTVIRMIPNTVLTGTVLTVYEDLDSKLWLVAQNATHKSFMFGKIEDFRVIKEGPFVKTIEHKGPEKLLPPLQASKY